MYRFDYISGRGVFYTLHFTFTYGIDLCRYNLISTVIKYKKRFMYVYMSVCTHVCTVCVCLSACTYVCVHFCPEALSADNLHLSLLSNITHTCDNDEPTTWQHFLDIAPCTIIVTSITSQDACHWNPTLLDH